MKSNFLRAWRLLPATIRKTIVLLIGSTSIITGLLLIVLPGPFTLPFLILGLVVLAAEFAWAESLLIQVRHHGSKINLRQLFRRKE